VILDDQDDGFAVTGVTLVIAVGELRPDFSPMAQTDWLTAQRTEELRAGCSVIHQDEFHVAPPNAKENTVSAGW
jgi:hypothetical protein